MDATAKSGLRNRLAAVPQSTRDFLLDGVASPIAPLRWFPAPGGGGPAALGPKALQWLLVLVWSVGFVWVWFTLFWVMLLWETYAPAE